MDFAFTPDQELLRATARTLLVRECPAELVRAHRGDPTAADPLWNHLRDFSALGAAPVVDLCVFVEELGYVAAPGPFFATTALFQPFLALAGSALAEAAALGEVAGTVALAGTDGFWTLNDDAVKTFVLEADTVDMVAVIGATGADGEASIMLVERPATRRVEMIDSSRRVFEVEVTPGDGMLVSADAVGALVERATVVLAAELVGTARRLFEMTLRYAKERHQFGVPIGSFQAIQHKLADMSLDVERAWSAVYYAAMAIDAHDADAGDRHRAVHVAKAAAGEAAKRAAKDGIQIHGGIGYTWEHDLHLFIRRAYASEALLGPSAWHHDRLADLLMHP